MSARIEWIDATHAVITSAVAGELDDFEETNEADAVVIQSFDGDGVIIEGTLEELRSFARRISMAVDNLEEEARK